MSDSSTSPPIDAPAAPSPAESEAASNDPARSLDPSPGDDDAPRAVEVAPSVEPVADNTTAGGARLGWIRSDQLALGIAIAVALVLMALHWARLGGWGLQPIEIERQPPLVFEYRLDVNEADRLDWAQLPGVGETLAERIVADREANGPFQSLDDLQRVKGIGPKTLDSLRPWIRLGDEAADE